jgi:hypothetical protein
VSQLNKGLLCRNMMALCHYTNKGLLSRLAESQCRPLSAIIMYFSFYLWDFLFVRSLPFVFVSQVVRLPLVMVYALAKHQECR